MKTDTYVDDCIFCKIVSGEISTPGIFWEDDNHLAMLSISPNTEGFSVVLPKKHHYSDVMQMEPDALSSCILAAQKAAEMLRNTFDDVGRVGVLMEGTGINHAHIKLAPMHHTEVLQEKGFKAYTDTKECWFDRYPGWISSADGPLADTEQLEQLAQKIKRSQ